MSENIAENQKFIELFNQIQQSFSNKVSEDTPGFRLYNDVKTSEISLEALAEAKRLFEELLGNEYRVEVVEDLDIINVTSDERYTIRIKNINSNVEYRYSLAKFREQLLDYSFEPDTFIIDILKRIEGAKGNTELKEIKDNILDFLSYAIHYKELFRSEYSTIGWDRYSFDNKTRIFKYNYIMSDNENIKGLIKGKYRDLYATSVDMLNEGLEENWRRFTIHLMNNHLYDSLIFAVGISGMIRQILTFTKETNLNVNVCGQPGSGKSTIGHYILSFFGSPTLLEGSSIDTENASERIRAERPVLPYVLDERMLRFFADSDTKKKTELLLEVFREYEGKEKERLGKQYEDSAGQRIYGPIISSSVESMLETLLQTGDDLGQYRRFIEFNIGKAEDEVLFNSEEAVKAEEIANSSYGYGVRYIAEYMLYRFKTDDNYFANQFREITELIKNRIEAEQELYKMKGLTSSSMRFALIILSYRVIRESIVYSLYAEIIDRKKILNSLSEADIEKIHNILKACKDTDETIELIKEALNNLSKADIEKLYNILNDCKDIDEAIQQIKEVFGSPSEENMAKKFLILEKCGNNEEIVEQIKQFNMSFEEFLVLENKQVAGSGLIINQEERIIDVLIDNLIEKMAKVKAKSITKDTLMKYFIRNYREHPEYFCAAPKDFDAEKHVFVYEDKADNITIQMPRAYKLDEVLKSTDILTPEEIHKNICINDENNIELINTWEVVYKNSDKDSKKGELGKTVNFITSRRGKNKLTINNPKKPCPFDVLVLKKGGFEADSDNKEEEQS